MNSIRAFLFLLFLVTLNLVGTTQSDQAVKDFALSYARLYCSNAEEIIKSADSNLVAIWMANETVNFAFSNFRTTVHEGLHIYDSRLGRERRGNRPGSPRLRAYFVNTGIVLTMERHKLFKTSTLHDDYFPDSVRNLSRYGTYIQKMGDRVTNENSLMTRSQLQAYGVEELRNGESKSSSNVWGFYGLLEEFNAYHHGLKAEYEILTQMEEIDLGRKQSNIMMSYYELNIFMAYYLKYAKENRRDIYDILYNDRELRTAYTLIELSWRELLSGIYDYEKTYNYYSYWGRGELSLFTSELKNVLEEFMIPVMELDQYQTYAESKKFYPDIHDKFRLRIAEKRIDKTEKADSGWYQIIPMEKGFFYVSLTSDKELSAIGPRADEAIWEFPEREISKDEHGEYFVIVGKFEDRKEAIRLANEIRTDYPDVEVIRN